MPSAPDRDAVKRFLASTPLDGADTPLARVARISRGFARFPYENLTKILHVTKTGEAERRMPSEVLADHLRWGSGGTCFALTYFLARILEEVGLVPRYLFADRSHAEASHTALLVPVGTRRFLVDPGYLLDRPIALDERKAVRLRAAGEDIELAPEPSGGTWILSTLRGSHRKFRYRLRDEPISGTDFLSRWRESSDWPMMGQIVLSRTSPGARHYLRDLFYHRVGESGDWNGRVLPGEGSFLEETFGISPELYSLASRALGQREGAAPGTTEPLPPARKTPLTSWAR